MEGISQLSIDELLVGTELLVFLQELVAIRDEEIVDNLPPIKEGDIVLGEMTPLEKRIMTWVDRRKAQHEQDIAAFDSSRCDSCTVQCDATAPAALCSELHAFDRDTSEGFGFLKHLIEQRFPDASSYALRAGFMVVSTAEKKESEPRSSVSVEVICVDSLADIPRILLERKMRSRV